MGLSKKLNGHHRTSPPPTRPTAPGATLKLPQTFWLSYRPYSSVLYLGAVNGVKDFAVTMPGRVLGYGSRTITIHEDRDRKSPALATLKRGSLGPRTVITVPAVGPDGPSEDVVGTFRPWGSSRRFELKLENETLERFEWRRSSGKEVKSLSAGSRGWKLVRMQSSYSFIGRQSALPQGYASDGREIVAVAAYPKIFRKQPKFQFMGSGGTGELGARFELAAAVSFLHLYEIGMQRYNAAWQQQQQQQQLLQHDTALQDHNQLLHVPGMGDASIGPAEAAAHARPLAGL